MVLHGVKVSYAWTLFSVSQYLHSMAVQQALVTFWVPMNLPVLHCVTLNLILFYFFLAIFLCFLVFFFPPCFQTLATLEKLAAIILNILKGHNKLFIQGWQVLKRNVLIFQLVEMMAFWTRQPPNALACEMRYMTPHSKPSLAWLILSLADTAWHVNILYKCCQSHILIWKYKFTYQSDRRAGSGSPEGDRPCWRTQRWNPSADPGI